MIELGRKLSLDVIAEGVETEAQASWLRRHHCPGAQGFHFSRPLPVDRLLDELARRPGRPALLAARTACHSGLPVAEYA